MSGFTSWKRQHSQKNLKEDIGDQGMYVYGMEWVDRTGMVGKYTCQVDVNDDPDGKGVMRYEFGLVAEGDWIEGVLNDGQGMGARGHHCCYRRRRNDSGSGRCHGRGPRNEHCQRRSNGHVRIEHDEHQW